MAEIDVEFEHAGSFEPGEISGSVGLGKFEATYSDLFSQVIDDGIITSEERAQLDRTATALGLDRDRIRALEAALQAVYELRHRAKIVEVGQGSDVDESPASLTPIEPATDARTQAFERRIAMLERRVKELEKELEQARAQMSVEVVVDVSAADAADAGGPREAADPEALRRRIRHDPRDVEALHALYRVHQRAKDLDRMAYVAHALVFLGEANDGEAETYRSRRVEGLIRPATSLSLDAWRRYLFHPEEEVLTGAIFAVIASAVLLGRISALRRDNQLAKLDPSKKQDPVQSTLQAVRCFSWAAAILGMRAPTLYADPEYAGMVEMVPGVPPATRLGRHALSGRSPRELAFVAGRHLAWYREERFVRLLVPAITDLEDLFLAALVIGNPGIPLRADTKGRVHALAAAIEPVLEPVQVDRLRGAFLRFVEEGGRTNLARWAVAADHTAARVGLLLSDDLAASAAMLEAEDPDGARERVDDLLVFVTSDRYPNLRKAIGIAAHPART